MQNLRNVSFGWWSHLDITSACWDPEQDDILCTVGPTKYSSKIDLVRVSNNPSVPYQVIATWDAPSPRPELYMDRVLDIQYLDGIMTTCLVLEGGDLVTIKEDQSSENESHIEIVGSIDAGILAARWSPDKELLALVTKANTLVLMGGTFSPIAEVKMRTDDIKASNNVSVGWGKKETQFQGRGAKALRDPTIPEKVDQGTLSAADDDMVNISWRGDGAYFSINTIEETSQHRRRLIRVYSREGELNSVSEPVDGLEGALSWRPAGNLMASVQRLEEQVNIVFFERNGLRHGQFLLHSPEFSITDSASIRVEWNSDSSVLAVILDSAVQLWTMENYHWYLKQEIPMPSGSKSVVWHPEKGLLFGAVAGEGLIMSEKMFHASRGLCRPPFDHGTVAVIDGNNVQLTPFRTANVPPPMSLFQVTTQSAAVDIAFGHQNQSFAVLHLNGIEIFDWPTKDGRLAQPQLRHKFLFDAEWSKTGGYAVPLAICCSSRTSFQIMSHHGNQGNMQTTFHVAPEMELNVLKSQQVLTTTSTYGDESTVEGYGQDTFGRIYQLTPTGNQLQSTSFHTHLLHFEVAKVDGAMIFFGLSRNGHIYANTRLLTKNCTSFVITPNHLVITTNNHFVKFIHLSANVYELELPADDPETDERCRNVERGSLIVTAIPTNMSIILQMPRGNLETIFPRAMVVAGIRDLIEDKNYYRAFLYCRMQRVDMNILYDHKPDQFLANVGLFLDQLAKISYIDLFLSGLKQEDVTQTMYQDTKRPKVQTLPSLLNEASAPPKSSTSKINTICDAILEAFQSRKSTHLQNIITAHVCKDPPALDDGLSLVAELMQDDGKLAENAVEHICFLVDANRLYENALGLYNLELALLVAQQSQRDPREYLPFIQDLHKQSELRRKFTIDAHLNRHAKALAHLQTLGAFEEFSSYTIKYALYQEALKLYRYDQARLDSLTAVYAMYLESKSEFREAGLAYESLCNYTKATSCYRSAGATCWRECLFTSQQQSPPLTADAMTELAESLAEALVEAKEFVAAASIYVDTLYSLEQAVKCLCKGYHFAEAIRLVAQHSRPDLLSTAVDTGLAEALGSTTEFLADCKAQLQAQVPRVFELRRKAVEDPLAFYEGERAGGVDIPDDVSIAASSRISTSASLFTRYTGKDGSIGTVGTGISRATSKNRRREEKKRARGRKGTVYEEEYLVNSIVRLVKRVVETQSEVGQLTFALVRRGMAERARAAEALMSEVTAACERCIDDIFPKENGKGIMDGRAPGGEGVLQEFVETLGRTIDPPVVTKMKKLALLGS